MSFENIPPNWRDTKLDNISSDISYGYTAKSAVASVGPHLLRITDIQDNRVEWAQVPYCEIGDKEKQKYLLKSGDLVFARTGATVGKSFLIKGEIPESVYASYLIRVRLPEQASIDFLSYFFQSPDYWRQITEFSAGIGQPNVNGSKLKDLSVPVPPLAEQKQIAAKLDELLAQVDTIKTRLDAIPQILKRFRQSVLAAAVSGRLTEEWRVSNSCSSLRELLSSFENERTRLVKNGELKKSSLSKPLEELQVGEMPANWVIVNFEHIASYDNNALKAGPFGSALKKTDCVNYGYRVYGQEQVIAGDESLVSYYIDESKYDQLSSCAVTAGDILISLVGTIGKVLVLSDNAEPGIIRIYP